MQSSSVQDGDGVGYFPFFFQYDETVASRFAGGSVSNNFHALDQESVGFHPLSQVALRQDMRNVTDEKLSHAQSPDKASLDDRSIVGAKHSRLDRLQSLAYQGNADSFFTEPFAAIALRGRSGIRMLPVERASAPEVLTGLCRAATE